MECWKFVVALLLVTTVCVGSSALPVGSSELKVTYVPAGFHTDGEAWCVRPGPGVLNQLLVLLQNGSSSVQSEVNVSLNLHYSNPDGDKLDDFVRLSCSQDDGGSASSGDALVDTGGSCEHLGIKVGVPFPVRILVGNSALSVIKNHSAELRVVVHGDQKDIPLEAKAVVIVDTRKLQVGFTDDILVIHRNGSVVLGVAALQEDVSLATDLHLLVTINSSLTEDTRTELVTISPTNTHRTQLVTFSGLDPSLNYEASLSVQTTELAEQVELVKKTLQRSVSLRDVLSKMDSVASNWRELYDSLVEHNQSATPYDKTLALYSAVEEELDILRDAHDLPTSAEETNEEESQGLQELEGSHGDKESEEKAVSTSAPEPTTSNPEPTTSNPEATTSNPEPTTSDPEPTTSVPGPTTSDPGHTTSDPGPKSPPSYRPCSDSADCADWEGAECAPDSDDTSLCWCGQDTVCDEATLTTTTATTDSTTEAGEYLDSNNGCFWWFCAAFVVVLVMCVGGYFAFSHREKVRVYVVSLWRGHSEGSSPTRSLSMKPKSRHEYTALPTSIS